MHVYSWSGTNSASRVHVRVYAVTSWASLRRRVQLCASQASALQVCRVPSLMSPPVYACSCGCVCMPVSVCISVSVALGVRTK